MEDAITHVLKEIGEDPSREGLQKTPARWAEAMKDLTVGYDQNLDTVINGALFEAETDGMVIVKDIECYSLCEHHLLPFVGKVHVAYVPDKHILGLSKVARVVDMFAKRLQTQERLTQQICDALEDTLKPKGIGVIVEAEHFCMMMRGVQKQHSSCITSAVKGLIKKDPKTREEFLRLVG
ncbi:MAG: GTP cyclohydrolase I FolE [Candidatus Peribacteraceae bacterium]|jgi:GTP cyclohydrolase I|nr:GTP cyclohydrolase I FolE [Candidatus Peribacteraceae bacterium]|tara:strand:- start:34066 stop:34605 length:540 start_codon:yes stop_codon:yes gene_type:complete